jgi:YfiH family protein
MKSPPADWIVPDWPVPTGVKSLITTRNGGVSRGPCASFNVGLRTGDDPQAVARNRALLRELLPQEPRWLRQEHGARVVAADSVTTPPEADASVARARGTICAIMIADCLPVLLTERSGAVVASAHAGWRGLAAGIVEATTRAMAVPPAEILAYLGPCIGPEAFEVGPDVYDAFVTNDAAAQRAFRPLRPGKWLADLHQLARQALARAGVSRIYGEPQCTYADSQRFFSYRRDRTTGRMAALIWRDP